MKIYDRIYDVAADNYGLITSAQAREIGVAATELCRLTKRGQLTRVGHGVYRIYHHVPEDWDIYAEAVALAGKEAYLYGESVLALHELCPTNPARMYIASPRRVRRSLSDRTILLHRKNVNDVTSYGGIPSQSIPGAIRSCRSYIDLSRLKMAADRARNQGLILSSEYRDLADVLAEENLEKAQ